MSSEQAECNKNILKVTKIINIGSNHEINSGLKQSYLYGVGMKSIFNKLKYQQKKGNGGFEPQFGMKHADESTFVHFFFKHNKENAKLLDMAYAIITTLKSLFDSIGIYYTSNFARFPGWFTI